jgi:hypothetical protein
MRRLITLFALVTAVACGKSGPISFLATTPSPAPDAYTCSLRKINELGYTVTNTNREAGFITGEKSTTGTFTRAMTGSQYASILTVSIFDDAAARKIRVSAGQSRERSNLFTTSKSTEPPSDVGVADAKALLNACGQGEITQQARATFVADEHVREGM